MRILWSIIILSTFGMGTAASGQVLQTFFQEDFGTTQVANGWNGYNNWIYTYGTPPASLSSQRSSSVCGFFSNVLVGNNTSSNRGTLSHAIPVQTGYVKLTGTYVAYYANNKDFRIGLYSSNGGGQPESGCTGVALRVGDGTNYTVSGVSTVAGTSTATSFVTLSSYEGETNFALEVNLLDHETQGLAARTAKATWNYGTTGETSTTFALDASLTSVSYLSIDKISYTTGVAGFDSLELIHETYIATVFEEDFGTTQVANGWNDYNNWIYTYGTPPASLSSQRSSSVCGFFSNVLTGSNTNSNRGTISHAIPVQTGYVKLTGTYVAYYANNKDFRIGLYSTEGGAQPESGCTGVSLRVGDGTNYTVSGVSTVAGVSTATPFVTLSSYEGETNFALEVNLLNYEILGLAARTAKVTWDYGTAGETSTTFAIDSSLTSVSYLSIDKISYTTGVAGFDNLVVAHEVYDTATVFEDNFGTTEGAWIGYNGWGHTFGPGDLPAVLSDDRSSTVCGFFNNSSASLGTLCHAIDTQMGYMKLTGTYVPYYAIAKDFRIGLYDTNSVQGGDTHGIGLRIGGNDCPYVSAVQSSGSEGGTAVTTFVTSGVSGDTETAFSIEINLYDEPFAGLMGRTAKLVWDMGGSNQTSTTIALDDDLVNLSFLNIDKMEYTYGQAGFDNLVLISKNEAAPTIDRTAWVDLFDHTVCPDYYGLIHSRRIDINGFFNPAADPLRSQITPISRPGSAQAWNAQPILTMYDRVLQDQRPVAVYLNGNAWPLGNNPNDENRDPAALSNTLNYLNGIAATPGIDNSAGRLNYLFMDFEPVGGSLANANVAEAIRLVREHANSRINQAFIGAYDYFPSGGTCPYVTLGLNIAQPSLYPYEYYSQYATGPGACPNVRSALFWMPLSKVSTAKSYLPTGHKLVPYVNDFVPVSGYDAPPPTKEDLAALVQHVRLRGADSYYFWRSYNTTGEGPYAPATNDVLRGDFLAAWKALDWLFTGVAQEDVIVYNLTTTRTTGLEWSAAKTSSGLALIVSNLGNAGQSLTSAQLVSAGMPSAYANQLLSGTGSVYVESGEHVVLTVVGELHIPGDANRDGQVNLQDLSALASHYGQTGLTGDTWLLGDFNNDKAVGLQDLSILGSNYGASGGAGFQSDTNQAFGITTAKDTEEESVPQAGLSCGTVGLPLIAGLFLACLGLGVRMKEEM